MAHIDFGTSAHAEGRRGLERIGSFCLLALAFFLPVFFVPALSFPFQFSKALLLSLFVLVIFSLWVVARLKDGEFVIPSSPLYIALGVIVGLFILSGLSSGPHSATKVLKSVPHSTFSSCRFWHSLFLLCSARRNRFSEATSPFSPRSSCSRCSICSALYSVRIFFPSAFLPRLFPTRSGNGTTSVSFSACRHFFHW